MRAPSDIGIAGALGEVAGREDLLLDGGQAIEDRAGVLRPIESRMVAAPSGPREAVTAHA
jgi:hypothetical protein